MPALAVCLLLLSQVAAPQPGEAFATLAEDVVLRAGPTENHVGVLGLPAGTAVRVGTTRGDARQVFVAGGFPVYVHASFARVDREARRVTLTGDRINARLLPSTVGLLPVGQVGADDGALELLDVERDWVRLVAPADMPLYGRSSRLTAASGPGPAQAWQQQWHARQRRHVERVEAERAGDPAWLARHDLELELGWAGGFEASDLDDASLARRRASLASLSDRAGAVGANDLVAEARRLLARVDDELALRDAELAATARQVREEQQDEARLESEAKALAMGLRFLGRGESVRIQGIVTRRASSSSDAEVFSISDGRRAFKLSAVDEVADLAALVGQQVVLSGRSLNLVSVSGPVLIVDEVVDIQG